MNNILVPLTWLGVVFYGVPAVVANSSPRFVLNGGTEIVVSAPEGPRTPVGKSLATGWLSYISRLGQFVSVISISFFHTVNNTIFTVWHPTFGVKAPQILN